MSQTLPHPLNVEFFNLGSFRNSHSGAKLRLACGLEAPTHAIKFISRDNCVPLVLSIPAGLSYTHCITAMLFIKTQHSKLPILPSRPLAYKYLCSISDTHVLTCNILSSLNCYPTPLLSQCLFLILPLLNYHDFLFTYIFIPEASLFQTSPIQHLSAFSHNQFKSSSATFFI